jgi:coproporphyrinogen III oxidase-like Fe-S oxidoreductase
VSLAALDPVLGDLPPGIDPEPIRAHLDALAPPYDVERWEIPLPVWATRPYDDGPAAAWRILQDGLDQTDRTGPMCIYVHVPFCSRKCGFCDCYSFAVRSNVGTTMDRYVETVCRELETWGSQGALGERTVSTAHLGGGTPTYLGPRRLARLIQRCRASFAIGSETELALETTVGALTPAMMGAMDELGVRRVHIGVQTLDDRVRQTIGRRDPACEVLARIGAALERGWVVSVDLVCGLPGQTTAGFVGDVDTLVALGVDGFSLYELLVYPQNRAWAEANGLAGRSHVANFVTFVAAAERLDGRGYAKRTFNHWANGRDADVYFTSPARGEDCLAVGTIADGVFGDYHFRHHRFAGYLRGVREGGIGLEGGLRRTAAETRLHPLVTATLSGTIAQDLVAAIDARFPDDEPLSEDWLERRLVARGPSGELRLTASGAWFAGDMVRALSASRG